MLLDTCSAALNNRLMVGCVGSTGLRWWQGLVQGRDVYHTDWSTVLGGRWSEAILAASSLRSFSNTTCVHVFYEETALGTPFIDNSE